MRGFERTGVPSFLDLDEPRFGVMRTIRGFPGEVVGRYDGVCRDQSDRNQSDLVMSANVFCCHYSGSRTEPRYEMWREEFARRWLPVDLEPVTGSCFAVEISGTKHSFLDLCNMQATPIHMRRRNDIVPDAAGHRFLLVASGSRLQARQRGDSSIYLPGRWFW